MNSLRKQRKPSRLITNAPFLAIFVHSLPGNRRKGRITAGVFQFPCALGKGGVSQKKREGDGATPLGSFPLRRLWYRSDVVQRPKTKLPLRVTKTSDGWCDAAKHRRYNKPVPLPFPASHERMWREDHLYHYVIEIGWNDQPAKPGRGSAIFMHLARPGYQPTEGCVAIKEGDMKKLLTRIGPTTRIVIQ